MARAPRNQPGARPVPARAPDPALEALGLTAEQAAVMRPFLRAGRLVGLPARAGRRRVVLDFLAGRFEPGRTYPEAEVNRILGRFHDDYAALRRYLVDEGFLDRRDGVYWRAGGTFEVD